MGKIRFPLELADGTKARSLEDLKDRFDLESVLTYYSNGKLLTWLQDRFLEDEVDAIAALDDTAPDFQEKLCAIFGVEYTEPVDMETLARRQERIEKLKQYTDDDEVIKNVDLVAFDQEELADRLNEGCERIYLCGDNFIIPSSEKGKPYIGVKEPKIQISGKPDDFNSLGISLTGCTVADSTADVVSPSSAAKKEVECTNSGNISPTGRKLESAGVIPDQPTTVNMLSEKVTIPEVASGSGIEVLYPECYGVLRNLSAFAQAELFSAVGGALTNTEVRSLKLTDIDRYMLSKHMYYDLGSTGNIKVRVINNLPEGLKGDDLVIAKKILHMKMSSKESSVFERILEKFKEARRIYFKIFPMIEKIKNNDVKPEEQDEAYAALAEARGIGWYGLPKHTQGEIEWDMKNHPNKF